MAAHLECCLSLGDYSEGAIALTSHDEIATEFAFFDPRFSDWASTQRPSRCVFRNRRLVMDEGTTARAAEEHSPQGLKERAFYSDRDLSSPNGKPCRIVACRFLPRKPERTSARAPTTLLLCSHQR